MPTAKKPPQIKVVKKRRPRASVETMIKREEAKLKRLNARKKLIDIRKKVIETREELGNGDFD